MAFRAKPFAFTTPRCATANRPWAWCCLRNRSWRSRSNWTSLGLSRIEAGFPRVSPEDAEAIQLMQKAGIKAELWGFSRAVKADVDELVRLGLKASVIESPTSDIKLKAYGISPDELLRRVEAAVVAGGTTSGIKVAFFAVDSTRTELDFSEESLRSGPECWGERDRRSRYDRRMRSRSGGVSDARSARLDRPRRSAALAWTQRFRNGNGLRGCSRARRSNLDPGHHQRHGRTRRQRRHRRDRARAEVSCTAST